MSTNDPKHNEVRAAKFSIDRSPNGVTLVIEAGELRLRFFIDGQWSDLLQQIHAGEGELGQLVPFQMRPLPVSAVQSEEKDEDGSVVSTRTIGAHPVPGLSQDETVFDKPLWQGAFSSLPAEDGDPSEDG